MVVNNGNNMAPMEELSPRPPSATAPRPASAAPVSVRHSGKRAAASAGASGDSVTVAVRVRPLGERDGECAMAFSPSSVTVSPGKSEHIFHFDSVYDGSTPQEKIYTELGAPLLRKALDGFNGTIFAYGQTGSGKTFTMSGGSDDAQRGIVPQLGDELFFLVDKAIEDQPDTKFLLTCSYLEIYNVRTKGKGSANP